MANTTISEILRRIEETARSAGAESSDVLDALRWNDGTHGPRVAPPPRHIPHGYTPRSLTGTIQTDDPAAINPSRDELHRTSRAMVNMTRPITGLVAGEDLADTYTDRVLQWLTETRGVTVKERKVLGLGSMGMYNGQDRRVSLAVDAHKVDRMVAAIHESVHSLHHDLYYPRLSLPAWSFRASELAFVEIVAETVTHMVLRSVRMDAISETWKWIPGAHRGLPACLWDPVPMPVVDDVEAEIRAMHDVLVGVITEEDHDG